MRTLVLERLRARPRPGWLNRRLGRDVLLVEDLPADHARLMERYRETGRWAAAIGAPQLDHDAAAGGFRLTWPIENEGPVYRIGRVTVEGDSPLSAGEVARHIELEPGAVARSSLLRAAEDRLRALLYERGHAFPTVALKTESAPAAAVVHLAVRIQAGAQPRFRAVRIEGLERTREEIVRREIPFRPGDPFRPAAALAARDALAATDLFSELEVEWVGGAAAEEFDLAVRVREQPTGRFEIGLSYSTEEGAALLARLSDRNLSLRPPGRGDALQGSLAAVVGDRVTRLEAALRNPRIGASRWSLGGRASYEDNRFASDFFDERRQGLRVLAGRPAGAHQVLSAGFEWAAYEIANPDPAWRTAAASERLDVRLAALVLGWDYARLDRGFRPTRGARMQQTARWGVEAFGGDTPLIEYAARASVYRPLGGDWVASLRGGLQAADNPQGDAPVPLSLRAFLGGAENLRGFAYRSVSPLDDDGRALGGAGAWWIAAECLAPARPWLDLALYGEMGGVSSKALDFPGEGPVSAWGFGLVFRARNFPVRFDIAFPIETLPGDRVNRPGAARIQFSTGYSF